MAPTEDSRVHSQGQGVMMKLFTAIILFFMLAGCSDGPTDEDVARHVALYEQEFADWYRESIVQYEALEVSSKPEDKEKSIALLKSLHSSQCEDLAARAEYKRVNGLCNKIERRLWNRHSIGVDTRVNYKDYIDVSYHQAIGDYESILSEGITKDRIWLAVGALKDFHLIYCEEPNLAAPRVKQCKHMEDLIHKHGYLTTAEALK
jgi:hypothetical protein